MQIEKRYKVVLRCTSDSIWQREEIFEGTYEEFLAKFGTRKQNPLKPFIRNEKIYVYYIQFFNRGFWHDTPDPRPKK